MEKFLLERCLIKLKDLDARAYLASDNPLAFALGAKMNYSKNELVRLKADFLRAITGTRENPARKELLCRFVETYMPLTEEQQARLERLVEAERQYREVKKMITVYEIYEKRGIEKGIEKGRLLGWKEGERQGIEKGLQQGIKKGIEKGVIEGKQDDLILFIEARFGPVSESKKRAVRSIRDVETLNRLVRRIAVAESLDELPL